MQITSVSVDYGRERPRVSAAHMGLAATDYEPFIYSHKTEDNRPVVSVEYIGGTIPAIDSTGVLSVTGRIAYSGKATCIVSVVRGAVGDLVRGSASFRMA